MSRRPPRATRTYTLVPDTPLFRSRFDGRERLIFARGTLPSLMQVRVRSADWRSECRICIEIERDRQRRHVRNPGRPTALLIGVCPGEEHVAASAGSIRANETADTAGRHRLQIGRAHV